jgi:cytochrome bd ubiquinol oxidase subunit II
VMRGMPLAPNVPLSLPLFTNFGVRGEVGMLDWYTLSAAAFTLLCLSAHGSAYLAIKTEGEVHRRCRRLSKRLWTTAFLLLAVVSAETFYVRPEFWAGMSVRPPAWAALAVVGAGLICIFTGLRSGAEGRTFLGGCSLIAGLLGAAAASLYPVMLHSTIAPEYSITAVNGSSDAGSLRAAAYWWPVAFGLALGYFIFIGRYYKGRVRTSLDTQQPY